MVKTTEGELCKFCRACLKLFTRKFNIYSENDEISPAVYVVHHQNMRGPVLSMAWLNKSQHPWVLSVFCSRRTCFKHFYEYTFTKRFGLPKVLAAIIVYPISLFVSKLTISMEAIPVYRGSREIVKTFKESIQVLLKGESLLISPDIDYTDKSSNVGEMYDGFLDLEKYYMKKTDKHLAFIPVHISKIKQNIYIGKAIYFTSGENTRDEKPKVYNRLKREFLRLEIEVDK